MKLYSRPGNDLTYRFPLIVEALAKLRSRSCIIDGETVVCGQDGVASFDRIRYHRYDASALYAFDLIELDGEDLRRDALMRSGWEGSSGQVLRDAASQLGISLVFTLPEKGTPSEIERIFAAIEQQRPDALLVSGEGDLYANRQLIVELSVKKRLPTMCPYRDHVEAGALMGYAVDLVELLRRMADDVHQILKGAKPGDIPIYQPTKFELLINLKTVNALGLILPPALLARADEVIE